MLRHTCYTIKGLFRLYKNMRYLISSGSSDSSQTTIRQCLREMNHWQYTGPALWLKMTGRVHTRNPQTDHVSLNDFQVRKYYNNASIFVVSGG